jgi:hypothetical protein
MRVARNLYRIERVFAWLPVKLESGEWAWLETVERITDERPEVYLGLLPEVTYNAISSDKK